MAIEVSVRKEIKSYQEKLLFGLSLRQGVCLLIAVVFSIGVGILNYFFIHWSIDDIGLLLIFLNIPILSIGWFKKENMPVEKYLRMVRKYKSLGDSYPYKTEVQEVKTVETEEKKERRKRTEYGN